MARADAAAILVVLRRERALLVAIEGPSPRQLPPAARAGLAARSKTARLLCVSGWRGAGSRCGRLQIASVALLTQLHNDTSARRYRGRAAVATKLAAAQGRQRAVSGRARALHGSAVAQCSPAASTPISRTCARRTTLGTSRGAVLVVWLRTTCRLWESTRFLQLDALCWKSAGPLGNPPGCARAVCTGASYQPHFCGPRDDGRQATAAPPRRRDIPRAVTYPRKPRAPEVHWRTEGSLPQCKVRCKLIQGTTVARAGPFRLSRPANVFGCFRSR